MGNGKSSNLINQSNNFIYIETNKTIFYQGDMIDGDIVINTKKPIQISSMNLILHLYYKSQYYSDSASSETKISNNKDEILENINIDLDKHLHKEFKINNNYAIHPDKYIIPFNIQLSKEICPTFEYDYEGEVVEINYLLEVQLNDILVHIKPIIITNLPKLEKIDSFSMQNNKDIYSFLFIKKGSTELFCNLNKSTFNYKEPIDVNVKIDNSKGKLKVLGIHIEYEFNIHLYKNKPNKAINEIKHILKEYDYKFEVLQGQIKCINLNIKNFLNYQEYTKIDYFSEYNIQDKSEFLLPSIKSKFFTSEYIIKLSLYFNSFVSPSDIPVVIIPLNILDVIHDDYTTKNTNIYYETETKHLNTPKSKKPLIVKNKEDKSYNNKIYNFDSDTKIIPTKKKN